MNIRDNEDRPMHYDEFVTIKFMRWEIDLLLKYAKEYNTRFAWKDLHDSLDKAWFCIMIEIIRKIEPAFRDHSDEAEHFFTYPELAVLNRFVKIIQIDIGEENYDQRFFQQIAQQLFVIL